MTRPSPLRRLTTYVPVMIWETDSFPCCAALSRVVRIFWRRANEGRHEIYHFSRFARLNAGVGGTWSHRRIIAIAAAHGLANGTALGSSPTGAQLPWSEENAVESETIQLLLVEDNPVDAYFVRSNCTTDASGLKTIPKGVAPFPSAFPRNRPGTQGKYQMSDRSDDRASASRQPRMERG